MASFQSTVSAVKSFIKETLPGSISLPYLISQLCFLSNEREFVGITDTGIYVHYNNYSKLASTVKISVNPLRSILLYHNETLACIQENSGVHCVDIKTTRITQSFLIDNNLKIAITPDEKYLFLGSKKGDMIRCKLNKLDRTKVICNHKEIYFFAVSSDSMIVVGIGKTLALFSMAFEKVCEKKMLIKNYTNIIFSLSCRFLLLGSESRLTMFFRNTLEVLYKIDTFGMTSCIISRDENYIIFSKSSGYLEFRDLLTGGGLLSIPFHQVPLNSLYLARDNSKLYVLCPSSLVYIKFPKIHTLLPYENSDPVLQFPQDFEILSQKFHKNLVFQSGKCKDIYIWDISNKKSRKLIGHEDIVPCLHILNNNLVVSGSNDFTIRIWDYNKYNCTGILQGHISNVTCISSKDKFLVSGSDDCTVKIWRWQDLILVHTLNFEWEIIGICCWTNVFIVAGANYLQMWDLQGLGIMASRRVKWEIDCLEVVQDGKMILVNKTQGQCIMNPMGISEISVWGDDNYYEFLEYLQGVINSSAVEHVAKMDSFIVMPYKFTCLAIYAYKNLAKFIEKSISSGAGIFNTISLENPFTISLEKKNYKCLSSLLLSSYSSNLYPFQYVILNYDDLTKINTLASEEISSLYKLLWKESETTLPRYCAYNTDLPITILSDTSIIFSTKFVPIYYENTGKEIIYFTSLIPFPIEIGSQSSINFLESLLKSHHSIFAAELIKKFILFKWNAVKWYIVSEALLYLVYFIYMIISIVYLNSQSSLIQTNIFSCIVSIWMTCKIFAVMGLSAWNIIDIFRMLLLIVYSVEKFGQAPYKIKYVLILVIILSAIQGIQYFCLFTHTRLIVKKIIGCLVSFFSFSSVITYLFVVLAVVLSATGHEDQFEISGWGQMHSAFISVVMLCLLMSLGNDIQNQNSNLDLAELVRIICEQEKLLMWKREKNGTKYFQQCLQSKKERKSSQKKLIKNTGLFRVEYNEILHKFDSLAIGLNRLEELAKSL